MGRSSKRNCFYFPGAVAPQLLEVLVQQREQGSLKVSLAAGNEILVDNDPVVTW